MVNTTNPSDITVVETKNKVTTYNRGQSNTLFNLMGDVVVFAGGYIADRTAYPANSTVCTLSNRRDMRLNYASRPNLRIGPYIYGFRIDNNATTYMYKLLDSAYLATINNLDKPVQKTADKTMKITYILREEA